MKREQLRRLVVLVLLVGGIGCGGPWDPTAVPPPILVITAMQLELAPLLQMTDVDGTEMINGRTHHLGRIGGVEVALVAGGVSMVNATMATQAAIDAFGVRAIVYCGIAGGASPRIRIGDVIVPEQWAQYQENVFTDVSRTGWRRGWRNESLGHFDMETAAVAHVAYANGIPYIRVRGISDMAGANPKENRVESYAPMAARNAASVVAALVHRMGAR